MGIFRVPYSLPFLFRTIFISVFFILFSILSGNAKDRNLADIIESQIFTSKPLSPDFLSEYKTGTWSWNITPLVNDIQNDFDNKESFITAIENSFELSGEYIRFTEDEAANDPEKAKINRYHLDPSGSDRVRYFTYNYWRDFKSGLALEKIPTASELKDMYLKSMHLKSKDYLEALPLVIELQLIIDEKHEEPSDKHISAYLFWRHP